MIDPTDLQGVRTVLVLALRRLESPIDADGARSLAHVLEGQASVLREIAGPESKEEGG